MVRQFDIVCRQAHLQACVAVMQGCLGWHAGQAARLENVNPTGTDPALRKRSFDRELVDAAVAHDRLLYEQFAERAVYTSPLCRRWSNSTSKRLLGGRYGLKSTAGVSRGRAGRGLHTH